MKRRIVTFCLNFLLAAISTVFALAAAGFALPFLHDYSLEEAVYHVRRPAVQYIHGEFHPALRYILTKIFIPRGFFIPVNLIVWLIPIGLVSAALCRISGAR